MKKGSRHTTETKEKMSKAAQNRPSSVLGKHWKIKDTSRMGRMGNTNGRGGKGRKLTEEHKQKIGRANSLALFGKFRGEANPRWKGGYKRHLWHNRNYQAALKNAPGLHTKEEWDALKRKYENMCLCCKRYEPEIVLTRDHIVPISKGGPNLIENMQPLCQSCNSKKFNRVVDFTNLISIP